MGVKLGRLKYLQALLVGCEVKWAVAAAKEWQEECEQQEQRMGNALNPGIVHLMAESEAGKRLPLIKVTSRTPLLDAELLKDDKELGAGERAQSSDTMYPCVLRRMVKVKAAGARITGEWHVWEQEYQRMHQQQKQGPAHHTRGFPGSLFYEASGEGVEPAELRLAPAGSGGWVVVAWKRR